MPDAAEMATILISDNRRQRRRYLAAILSEEGHEILESASSEETLALALDRQPDLVLVNVLMPPPGGYRFLGQLRGKPGLVLPRVLFIAAPHMSREAGRLGQSHGVSRILADRPDRQTLLAAVGAALAGPRPESAELDEEECELLYPILMRLQGRVSELECFNARLERSIAFTSALLATARSALDREVGKRLSSEAELRQENRRRQAVCD